MGDSLSKFMRNQFQSTGLGVAFQPFVHVLSYGQNEWAVDRRKSQKLMCLSMKKPLAGLLRVPWNPESGGKQLESNQPESG